ncbi:MAG: hypothetical protein WC209_13600 [Ignavibacteriaceae bacterium]|jgi:hypothetical protein
MKIAFKNLYIFLFSLSASVTAQTLQSNFPVANGTVNAMVQSGNTVYLGGAFNYFGPNTGRAVLLDQSTGTFDLGFPNVNGNVNAVLPDGAGGWYIGGDFTSVGGAAHNYVAHIKADKSVDSWDPNVVGSNVFAFAKYGSTIYFGGQFATVGGLVRENLAAVDSATGVPSSWHPDPDNAVYSIAVNDTNVFIGGNFLNLGNAMDTVYNTNSRPFLASIYRTSNILSVWQAGVSSGYGTNYTIYGLIINPADSNLYVCGNFGNLGGSARKCIGSLKTTNTNISIATTFNPNLVNSTNWKQAVIYTMAISGDTIFVGGSFKKYGRTTTGTVRNGLAASLISTNVMLTTFGANGITPAPVGLFNSATYVRSLAVSNGVVYVGGKFTGIGAQTQGNMGAIGSVSGSVLSWNPNASEVVSAVGVYGSNVFAGGNFTSVNGQTRNCLAAVDVNTGTLLSWDPNISTTGEYASALAVSGSTVYVGGYITSIGGQSRTHLAAVDATTGAVSSWQANTNYGVATLAISGNTLYVGGYFSQIGGAAAGDTLRNNLAALDATTGSVLPWNPNSGGSVYALALSGSTVYVGGSFSTIDGQTRNQIAALDASTGNATAWNPNANLALVKSLAVSGSTVYAGGNFTQIGSTPRNYIAAISTADTGSVTSWDPNITGAISPEVDAIVVNGSTVYVGGLFGQVGASTRVNVAAIDASTGSATSWNPSADGSVYALLADQVNQKIYLGGVFSDVLDKTASFFAAVDNPGDAALPVELTTFTAISRSNNNVELNWRTATEKNNYGFEIERTFLQDVQKKIWEKIGFVNGSGTSNSPKEYSFSNKVALPGRYAYRLKQVDADGSFKYSSIAEVEVGGAPRVFTLGQNFPNPFNPTTMISFTLPSDGRAVLKIFNTLGQEVVTLFDEEAAAGKVYGVTFDAAKLTTGIYFSRLEFSAEGGSASGGGRKQLVRKLLLLK